MRKMVRAGWYKESFRHSLAARGITTKKYMAPKFLSGVKDRFTNLISKRELSKELGEPVSGGESERQEGRIQDVIDVAGGPRTTQPSSAEKRLKGEQSLSGVASDVVIGTRDIEVALDNLDKKRPAMALKLIAEAKKNKLSSENISQLKTALGVYSVSLAQSGVSVPKDIRNMLDKNFKTRIDALSAEFDREGESALRTQLRQAGRSATAAVVDALPSALKGGGLSQISTSEKEFTGLSKNIDNLENTPFFDPVNGQGEGKTGANAFIDDKGKFGDFDVPKTSDMFNFEPLASGGRTNIALKDDASNITDNVTNIALGEEFNGRSKVKTPAENVSEQVESLYKEKAKLSEVDLSAFDVGNKAFKKGDREGLISAITELQSQEGMLKDRWDLVGQTHAQLKGTENHDSAFIKKKSGLMDSFVGNSGAEKFVEQTEKLSDVRGEIMKASNEAFGRRKMLEFRLQRLDSNVPPETWTPNKITRFDDKEKNLTGIFDKVVGW